MNILDDLEIKEGYAAFRPVRLDSLRETLDVINAALRFCAEHKIKRVMVNATALTGIVMPTVTDRYFAVKEFAASADHGTKFVLVIEPALIDPKKFGVTAAMNQGLDANVFPTESEAIAWLISG